jgi:hypothetical protein
VERATRTLIIGAAFATGWWLLHDPAEPELPASRRPPTTGNLAQPRSIDSPRDDAVEVVAVPSPPAVAEVGPRVPAAADWPAVAQTGGTGVAAEPIPMIDGIMLPGGMWNLHAAMERESRDVEWADQMERELSSYFASKSELGRNFGQPSVICRSQSCEVKAIGYGPRAFDTWAAATQDLRDQPWRQEMRAGGIYTIERAPNEHAVVLILMRPLRFPRDRSSEVRAVPPQ